MLDNSSKCSTLTSLDLTNNVLGRARPARLYPALARFMGHHEHKTNITNGFDFMLTAAASCTALRTLDLACNYITEQETRSLRVFWGLERAGLTF